MDRSVGRRARLGAHRPDGGGDAGTRRLAAAAQAPQGVFGSAFNAVNPTLAANLRAAWRRSTTAGTMGLNYTQSKRSTAEEPGLQSPSWEA